MSLTRCRLGRACDSSGCFELQEVRQSSPPARPRIIFTLGLPARPSGRDDGMGLGRRRGRGGVCGCAVRGCGLWVVGVGVGRERGRGRGREGVCGICGSGKLRVLQRSGLPLAGRWLCCWIALLQLARFPGSTCSVCGGRQRARAARYTTRSRLDSDVGWLPTRRPIAAAAGTRDWLCCHGCLCASQGNCRVASEHWSPAPVARPSLAFLARHPPAASPGYHATNKAAFAGRGACLSCPSGLYVPRSIPSLAP